MSLAVPSALLFAALAVPIVFFYILKVRLRRVEVSTNLFWKQVYDEKPPRSLWQYLRHLLSLLMQLALLTLFVFAIADPYFPWQLLQARRVVMVIDNSASMQAKDIDPTRFEAAIDEAHLLTEGLRFRDEMAIVLAGPRPGVVLGMSGHIPTLKRTLDSIRVSDNPTTLSPAIELARRLVEDQPRGQIVVFTDGCVEASEVTQPVEPENTQSTDEIAETAAKSVEVDYRLFGTPTSNLGITQFQVRRSLIDPLGYEVLVAVMNSSDTKVSCRLEIELDDAPVDILPLDLQPEETWSRSLEKTSLEGGQLVATLNRIMLTTDKEAAELGSVPEQTESDELNALTADDTAWAILPARERQKVLLITEGNLFLQKVFEANPLVQVDVMREFPDQWPSDTLIVLHGEIPEELPEGNVFVVDPAGSCDAWELGDVLENPIVTEQDQDSPLLTHVRLDNILMPEAREVKFKSRPHVLAGSLAGSPIYAELKRSQGKCLVLTVNLDRSDLTFRTAFPIMVANALGWYAGTAGELRESSATGSFVEFEVDTDLTDSESFVLSSPSGREAEFSTQAGDGAPNQKLEAKGELVVEENRETRSLGPLDECGIWSVREQALDQDRQSEALAEYAVNLTDNRESDLRPDEVLLAQAGTKTTLAGWFARPVWFYLVAVGCSLSVLEWILYQRRVIS